MVVEEVQVTSRKPFDFRQGVVYPLRVKSAATLKEGVFVAEVAVLGTSARYYDGVRHQVIGAPNEIAADGRNPFESPARG
jgi:hypothetical protein